MIVYERLPNVFIEITKDMHVGDLVIPFANLSMWSTEELAAHGAYRVELPSAPDGQVMTKYTIARIDGAVTIVPEFENAPPQPAPLPPKIHKRLFIERLAAAGLLQNAFYALGGPGTVGYERWQASNYVDTGNAEVRGLISALGGDFETLLAPDPDLVTEA